MLTHNLENVNIKRWWETRRWEYNKALLISGAFSVVLTWFAISLEQSSFIGIPFTIIMTILFLAFYGVYMTVINLLYSLGSIVDITFNKSNDDGFRELVFTCGYWLSVLMLPVMIMIYISGLLISIPTHSYQVSAFPCHRLGTV